ncbi:unnamed protein product [Prorocentrum cordatum]|uniref:Peptidase C1A papain C-terminal domain-containing protein n=1 Tax=Prorocentrum cordatum TaxID=2364126 RepID=A0ABN9XDJ9_9DINO|nr:unnamed protein product [Polarella glacialis]
MPHRAFAEFVAKHGLAYHEGHPEHGMRRSLFEAWTQMVEQHNARTDANWRAGVNRFAAHTAEELAQLRGYVRGSERTEGTVSMPGAGRLSMLQVPSRPSRVEDLPAAFGWKGKLNATSSVLDQKGCGSCWAVSSVTALRAHSELFQRYRQFSIQQVLSCAPNPHKCGGSGGCGGATAEIAMDYAAKVGLLTEDELPYRGEDGECPSEVRMPEKDALDVDLAGTGASLVGYSAGAKPGMDTKSGLLGFHKLASNKIADLMLSIHNVGPAVVSIMADGGWSLYESGVYDGCVAGGVINHAVTLIGWGKDKKSGLKYWHLQNSWSSGWGEDGFIRIARQELDEEEANCGWDTDPLQGSGCEGGPSKVLTCGSCGILFDAVVPRFSESEHGWWAQHSGAAD